MGEGGAKVSVLHVDQRARSLKVTADHNRGVTYKQILPQDLCTCYFLCWNFAPRACPLNDWLSALMSQQK